MATAVVKISQFSTNSSTASLKEDPFSSSKSNTVREITASKISSIFALHLPAVIHPFPAASLAGWETPSPQIDFWSDSPTRQPLLLYRQRFSFGRDEQELFPKDGRTALSEGDAGDRLFGTK